MKSSRHKHFFYAWSRVLRLLMFLVMSLASARGHAQKPQFIPQTLHDNDIEHIAISKDGENLITSTASGQMKIWDMRARKVLKDLNYPSPLMIKTSNDGKFAGIINRNALYIIDLSTLEEIHHKYEDLTLTTFDFSADSKHVAYGANSFGKFSNDPCYFTEIIAYDLNSWTRTDSITGMFCHDIQDMTFKEDGALIAIGDNNKLKFIGTSKKKIANEKTFDLPRQTHYANLVLDSKRNDVLLSGFDIDSITVFNIDRQKVTHFFPLDSIPSQYNFAKHTGWNNENVFFSTDDNLEIRMWDLASRKRIKIVPSNYSGGPFGEGVFSPITHSLLIAKDRDVVDISLEPNDSHLKRCFRIVPNQLNPSFTAFEFDQNKRLLGFINRGTHSVLDMNTLNVVSSQNLSEPTSSVIYASVFSHPYFKQEVKLMRGSGEWLYFFNSNTGIKLDSIQLPQRFVTSAFYNFAITNQGKILIKVPKKTSDAQTIDIEERKEEIVLIYDITRSKDPVFKKSASFWKETLADDGTLLLAVEIVGNGLEPGQQRLVLYDIRNGKEIFREKIPDNLEHISQMKFLGNEKVLLSRAGNAYIYDLNHRKIESTFAFYSGQWWMTDHFFTISNDRIFFLSPQTPTVYVYNMRTAKMEVKDFGLKHVEGLAFLDTTSIVISEYGARIHLFDYNSTKLISTIQFVSPIKYYATTPDGFYFSNVTDQNFVSYQKGKSQLSIEFLDLKYNRPDTVLRILKSKNSKLIKDLTHAYQKRLSLYGITGTSLEKQTDICGVEIANKGKISFVTHSNTLGLILKNQCPTSSTTYFNIWINNVPMYGRGGRPFPEKGNSFDVNVSLSVGQNKIQISSIQNGVEIFTDVNYTHSQPLTKRMRKLYFFGLAVSKYQNLEAIPQAVHDIEDFTDELKKIEGFLFDSVIVNNYTDEAFDRPVLEIISKKIKNLSVDDGVVFYYTGHGNILNNELFVGTQRTNIADLQNSGIKASDLEDVFHMTSARNRLLILNTCYSGEFNEDMETFQLMQRIFPDLRKNTGAVVISSSSGIQRSRSKEDAWNSFFGAALERAIYTTKEELPYADEDGDGRLSVDEVFRYAEKRTFSATYGKQSPTLKKSNPEINFILR